MIMITVASRNSPNKRGDDRRDDQDDHHDLFELGKKDRPWTLDTGFDQFVGPVLGLALCTSAADKPEAASTPSSAVACSLSSRYQSIWTPFHFHFNLRGHLVITWVPCGHPQLPNPSGQGQAPPRRFWVESEMPSQRRGNS